MPRSASAEPPKSSKRKGTRSVSTLTPSQLARKRANDREAQRAIRARTKEHIERLERELAELKSHQNRDKTLQELLRRNKALEEEIARLKEHMGISVTSSPYSAPAVYDDSLSSGSGAVHSPRMSPLPSGDYAQIPDYSHSYSTLSSGCETWASSVPNSVLSSVSTPSSPGHGEEYSAAYIPTSVPASMMTTGPRIGGMDSKDIKLEFEEMENSDAGFRLSNSTMQGMSPAFLQQQHQHSQQQYQQQQQQQQQQPQTQRHDQWNVYPMYYQGQPDQRGQNAACVSR